MDSIYKKVAGLQGIPAVINIAGTVFVFLNYEIYQFAGFFLGALLGVILSVIWVLQIKEALYSHAIRLMKITFKGLLIKVAVFLVFMILAYAAMDFDIMFFAVSFFIALFLSAIIEIWFYTTLIRKIKKNN
jgi:hypothetical protein